MEIVHDREIPVLYEDSEILVIDKPAGITVNRAETTHGKLTIQDWAEDKIGIHYEISKIKYNEVGWTPEHDFSQRGGIVHRLDKETSGMLVLAKTPAAFARLQSQFKERTVQKTYLALAHGKLLPRVGDINVPVGRLPWNRNRFGILPGGRESKTLYTVLGYYQTPAKETLSLIELSPQSGRTHQIRVHLKYLNHPIISDELYGGRKTARNDRKVLQRLFLHAAKLSFTHPTTGVILSFESPLPSDLSQFLHSLVKVED